MEDIGTAPPLVQISQAPDGTLVYRIAASPEDLPAVLGRDLARGWAMVRQAKGTGPARLFRFRRADGHWTDLALADRDACRWAAALDRTVPLRTACGLSLCLRLLALVELMARARWASELVQWHRGESNLHPALLRAVADASLTANGGLDESQLRSRLGAALAGQPAF